MDSDKKANLHEIIAENLNLKREMSILKSFNSIIISYIEALKTENTANNKVLDTLISHLKETPPILSAKDTILSANKQNLSANNTNLSAYNTNLSAQNNQVSANKENQSANKKNRSANKPPLVPIPQILPSKLTNQATNNPIHLPFETDLEYIKETIKQIQQKFDALVNQFALQNINNSNLINYNLLDQAKQDEIILEQLRQFFLKLYKAKKMLEHPKYVNLSKFVYLLYKHQQLTGKEIMAATGISRWTLSNYLHDFRQNGLVTQAGGLTSTKYILTKLGKEEVAKIEYSILNQNV